MKVSFGSWSFTFGPYARKPVSFAETVRRIAEAGYDGIEISGFPPHLAKESSSQERKNAQKLLTDLGLSVSGYVPDFTMVNPLISDNRALYLENFQRAVDAGAELGSPSIRVDTIGAPGSVPEGETAAIADHLAGLWRDAAELAARSKVKVLWEFEPGFAFNKPSEIVDIYEQVGHPNFQILFDTAHAYLCAVVGARQQGQSEVLGKGVAEFLDRLSGRIGHLHIVDTDGTLYGEETSTHCALGEGIIDFHALTPRLLAVPGIEWWCIDMSFVSDCDPVLKPSLAFVRKMLR